MNYRLTAASYRERMYPLVYGRRKRSYYDQLRRRQYCGLSRLR